MKAWVIGLVLFMLGCATYGTKLNNEDIAKIQKGITTEEEVISMLGAPENKNVTDDGSVIMTYIYTKSKPKLRNFVPYVNIISSVDDVSQQTLSILIKDGIVDSYAVNEKETEMKFGLVN